MSTRCVLTTDHSPCSHAHPVKQFEQACLFQERHDRHELERSTANHTPRRRGTSFDIGGYAYTNADINGMNVMLRESGVYRLYFGDFHSPGGTFRATGTDGSNTPLMRRPSPGPALSTM